MLARCTGAWADSPKLARLIWDRVRGETPWYATDCELLDEHTVQIFVYNMHDKVTGGIGECFLKMTFPIVKFGPGAQGLARDATLEAQTKFAQQEFIRRENEARQRQIEEIRKELFGM